MDKDLQIHIAAPAKLTIENPPGSFDTVYALILIPGLIFFVFLTWKLFTVKRWVGILVGVVFLLVGLIISSTIFTGYRMEIDRSNNSLIYSELNSKGESISPKTVELSSVERADMEFNRTQRRIVVSLKNGSQVFPLGDGFSYEDSQFKALDLIRQYICQKPFDESAPCKGTNTKP